MWGRRRHAKGFVAVLALAFAIAGVALTSASGASFDDTGPCPNLEGPFLTCPTGVVGKPYDVQLKGTKGCDQYWYEVVNSSLPAGLTMTSGGRITGVPAAAGRAELYIHIHDLTASQGGYPWCGGDQPSQKQFVFNIEAGLSIANQSVKGGTIGQPYSETLKAQRVVSTNPFTGTDVQATWSVQSGTLPPGITLTSAGVLEGTPTAEGTSQFVIQAQNGGQSDTETYTITVRQPVTITSPFASTSLPKSEVSVPFTATFTAAGGSGTYTWALASGALPDGVTFDPAAAIAAGTPEEAGNFEFSVSATDTEGRVTTVDATMVVAPALAIKTKQLRPAKLGRLYKATLKTSGGAAPVKWQILRGALPRGIHFAKKLGTFVGTPRRLGTYRVTVQATDSLGVKSQQPLTIVVKA